MNSDQLLDGINQLKAKNEKLTQALAHIDSKLKNELDWNLGVKPYSKLLYMELRRKIAEALK